VFNHESDESSRIYICVESFAMALACLGCLRQPLFAASVLAFQASLIAESDLLTGERTGFYDSLITNVAEEGTAMELASGAGPDRGHTDRRRMAGPQSGLFV
jgi:hypothetical protein